MITIKAENLTRKFGILTALDHLNLEVEEAEIFGLVGPDGAGKTTTMRLLAGILDPTEGQAWVYNKHIVRESESLKENIAYMSQRFGLYEELSVLENINFYADVYGVAKDKRLADIERLLGFSGLLPFKQRLAGKLSGGMKQKLGLACALIHTPKVLFLDEPTNGVDPVSRRDFWNILYELLKEKVTIFCSTCYLDEAERCRRVGLLHKGKLLRCDSPETIKKERNVKTLEEAFIAIIKECESKETK
jgi:ABC-2 type transport system ATP-binding protein